MSRDFSIQKIKPRNFDFSKFLSPYYNRGSRIWTHDLRFWRPIFYQLNYTPIFYMIFLHPQNCILPHPFFSLFLGQALDRLVTVSSTCCHASTPALSTSSSSRGLTSFRYGISHLEGGFTLRCLQRLSLPNLATRLWLWSPTGIPAVRPSRSSRTKDGSP